MSPIMKTLFLELMPKILMMRRTHYSLPDYDDASAPTGYTNEIDVRYVIGRRVWQIFPKLFRYPLRFLIPFYRDSISDFPGGGNNEEDCYGMGPNMAHSLGM